MAIIKQNVVRGANLNANDFEFDDTADTIRVKTGPDSSVGQAIAAGAGATVGDASATAAGIVNLQPGQVLGAGSKVVDTLFSRYAALDTSSIDVQLGDVFSRTVSGATTFAFTNAPAAGLVASFVLELTNGGSASVSWPAGTKWEGGTAPTLTSSGIDLLGFYTRDGGVTWRGMLLVKDSK